MAVEETASPRPRYLDTIGKLISAWESGPKKKILAERDHRRFEMDSTAARAAKKVLSSETFIPQRVIDNNIRRESPVIMGFVTEVNRPIIIGNVGTNQFDFSTNEQAFASASRYQGWQIPYRKCVDSAATFGRGVIQVIPANNALGYILDFVCVENFIFPEKSQHIQNAGMCARRYEVSSGELDEWAQKYAFDPENVKKLRETECGAGNPDDQILAVYELFHVFRRERGPDGRIMIMCGWYSSSMSHVLLNKDWTPYLDGTLAADNTPGTAQQYPFFIYQYEMTEKPYILQSEGRAAYDLNHQEAETALVTDYMNACNRASGLYPSRKVGQTESSAVTATIELAHGMIMDQPLDIFVPPMPPASTLSAVNYLRTSNLQDIGQVDFAADNRVDSRKTAAEIKLSRESAAKISSLPVLNFSIFVLDIGSYIFNIHLANSRGGTLLSEAIRGSNEAANEALRLGKFVLMSAGDVDYVQRADKIVKIRETLGMLSQFPAAQKIVISLLRRYLQLVFPEQAAEFTADLQDNSQGITQQLLAALTTIMPELPPDLQQQLQPIIQNATAALNSHNTAGVTEAVDAANRNTAGFGGA